MHSTERYTTLFAHSPCPPSAVSRLPECTVTGCTDPRFWAPMTGACPCMCASYPSLVDVAPAVKFALRASTGICSAAHRAALFTIRLDAAVDDAFHASLRYAPHFFYTLFLFTTAASIDNVSATPTHSSSPVRYATRDRHQGEARLTPKSATSPPPTMSQPPSTCAKALLASRLRRCSPRHKHELTPGQSSVVFVVDSGCTWHIHPHMSDLVNPKPCSD
eukprot:6209667-Pleurochrysis_carterae.AAC.2